MILVDKWHKAAKIALLLLSLGLIIWSGIVFWQLPCRQDVGFSLVSTPLCPFALEDIVPIFVALGFWIIGLVIWIASEKKAPILFFLMSAGVLSTGALSGIDSTVGGRPFTLLLIWLAPSLYRFHIQILKRRPKRQEQIVLVTLFGLAVMLSLPPLLWPAHFIEQQAWFSTWRLSIRLSLALAFVLTLFLLSHEYRQPALFITRRHIRLITFGSLFAFAPLLLLSLLPSTLGSPVYVPYAFTFPWLLLSPLTYAYAFSSNRLDRDWVTLNRAVVNYALVVLLLTFYLMMAAILTRLSISLTDQWLLVSALLSIALIFIFRPLQGVLGRLVSWVWHGREKDYTAAIAALSTALALALDRRTLQRLLLRELAGLMSIAHAALFLVEETDKLVMCGDVGFNLNKTNNLPLTGQVAALLKETRQPLTAAQLRRQVNEATLQAAERNLLFLPNLTLWLPLVSCQTLQGLLLLGPKSSRESFTTQEKRLLVTLSYQAGATAHNIGLVTEIKAKQQELARIHRRLLVTQEQERQRIARWLHDSIIQQLLGLTYQLAIGRKQVEAGYQFDGQKVIIAALEIENVRQEILAVVARLRQLTGDLRPAGLDELGLSAAIEGCVARLEREYGPDIPLIELNLDPIGITLPEPVAICLFRAAQEGLRNALKHAQAAHIELRLAAGPEKIVLQVCDNGRGFHVPARLSQLAWHNHYGLVGIAEQVTSLAGAFTIHSQPGLGTEMLVQVSILERENDYE